MFGVDAFKATRGSNMALGLKNEYELEASSSSVRESAALWRWVRGQLCASSCLRCRIVSLSNLAAASHRIFFVNGQSGGRLSRGSSFIVAPECWRSHVELCQSQCCCQLGMRSNGFQVCFPSFSLAAQQNAGADRPKASASGSAQRCCAGSTAQALGFQQYVQFSRVCSARGR
jgi:hypothetical protein